MRHALRDLARTNHKAISAMPRRAALRFLHFVVHYYPIDFINDTFSVLLKDGAKVDTGVGFLGRNSGLHVKRLPSDLGRIKRAAGRICFAPESSSTVPGNVDSMPWAYNLYPTACPGHKTARIPTCLWHIL
jgi:hypothetical protein